jgi:hypothetical protein
MTLQDQLDTLGLTPSDLVALGAAMSAFAGSALIMRQALRQVEMQRAEMAEETPESRAQRLEILRLTLRDYMHYMGPEGWAQLVQSADIAEIIKESLMVGSVLPDES